jgi:hypothetical protein
MKMDKTTFINTMIDMGNKLMSSHMERIIAPGKTIHGDKFDASDLDPRFARYYFSKERIKIKDSSVGDIGNQVLTGTVGKTTGWKPVFLLMRNSRSVGSSTVLNNYCEIIGVQQKGSKKYSNPY